MHNSLHTPLPHAYTHEQQQHLSDISGNGGNDSSDDSDSNDDGISGKLHGYSMAAFNNLNAEAAAAEPSQSRRLAVGQHRGRVGSALVLRQLCQPVVPAVSASSAAAANGSSCVQSVCCVSAASHVKLTS